MVFGGYGEVGSAVCRQLLLYNPKELIVTSLRKEEALSAVEELSREVPKSCKVIPWYGNIFVRWSLKDTPASEISVTPEYLHYMVNDIFEELTEEIISSSTLYRVILEYRPEIIVDCINTSTALAYQNVYQYYEEICQLHKPLLGINDETNSIYKVLGTMCVPPLVRHIQILYEAMKRSRTEIYLKVGTTGTGGMGLNIPFTHGEESPSRLLMSKTALAGAHTMLLFALSRVPGGPIIKEIKPAAMVGWKCVNTGRILKSGQPLPTHDCPPDNAFRLTPGSTFRYDGMKVGVALEPKKLEGTYVDTGENGVFSLDEFKVITDLGLMGFVTPEEIAHLIILEIHGDNTSKDVIGALSGAAIGPSYRAGLLRENVIKYVQCLNDQGVAYGFLGPRAVKMIFEAKLLKLCYGTMTHVLNTSPNQISHMLANQVYRDETIRSSAISIGIPILLPDGERILFAHRPIPDKSWEKKPWLITPESIDDWACREWIDLRSQNMAKWQDRFRKIMQEAIECSEDNSSRFDRGQHFWSRDKENSFLIDPGEIVAWILTKEYGGGRKFAYTLPRIR